MSGLILIGIILIIIDVVRKACEPTIPSENWKNVGWDVFDKDTNTVQTNLRNGKYK